MQGLGIHGAAAYNGNQPNWYSPFSDTTLPSISLPAGTYSFRIVNPADAASLFPSPDPRVPYVTRQLRRPDLAL